MREPVDGGTILDGMTYTVIVSRLQQPTPYGEWLVRVYFADEHVHSSEGGISLEGGLDEAKRAMLRDARANGARDLEHRP